MITITVEADRAELHGSTKGDADEARVIVRPWVWSRHAAGYVLPRSLRPQTRAYWVSRTAQGLRELGREVEVSDSGEVQTESERREARTERLEIRADRHEGTADRLLSEAEQHAATFDRIKDSIPMGQPILVGHHSERRHRRDLDRMGRALSGHAEAMQGARDAERKAENLRRALENGEPLGVIRRRIERNGADLRRIERTIEEHGVAVKIRGTALAERYGHAVREVPADRLAMLTAERDRLAEAVELDEATVKARDEAGEHAWGRADFRKGDKVVTRWGPTEVKRVNAKSLTIPSIVGGSWTDTLPYDAVHGRIRDGVTWDGKGADPAA